MELDAPDHRHPMLARQCLASKIRQHISGAALFSTRSLLHGKKNIVVEAESRAHASDVSASQEPVQVAKVNERVDARAERRMAGVAIDQDRLKARNEGSCQVADRIVSAVNSLPSTHTGTPQGLGEHTGVGFADADVGAGDDRLESIEDSQTLELCRQVVVPVAGHDDGQSRGVEGVKSGEHVIEELKPQGVYEHLGQWPRRRRVEQLARQDAGTLAAQRGKGRGVASAIVVGAIEADLRRQASFNRGHRVEVPGLGERTVQNRRRRNERQHRAVRVEENSPDARHGEGCYARRPRDFGDSGRPVYTRRAYLWGGGSTT